MSEEGFLKELTKPLFFSAAEFGRALERYSDDNPFHGEDELTGDSSPVVDGPIFNITTGQTTKIDTRNLADFPDVSDEIMTDYRFRMMMGEDVQIPKFVDLDTAEDFVEFTKNTLGNILASEQEFDAAPSTSENLLTEIKDILLK
jgi:hypothetical protein